MSSMNTLALLISSSSSWNLLFNRPNLLMFCWSSHVTSVSDPPPFNQIHEQGFFRSCSEIKEQMWERERERERERENALFFCFLERFWLGFRFGRFLTCCIFLFVFWNLETRAGIEFSEVSGRGEGFGRTRARASPARLKWGWKGRIKMHSNSIHRIFFFFFWKL